MRIWVEEQMKGAVKGTVVAFSGQGGSQHWSEKLTVFGQLEWTLPWKIFGVGADIDRQVWVQNGRLPFDQLTEKAPKP